VIFFSCLSKVLSWLLFNVSQVKINWISSIHQAERFFILRKFSKEYEKKKQTLYFNIRQSIINVWWKILICIICIFRIYQIDITTDYIMSLFKVFSCIMEHSSLNLATQNNSYSSLLNIKNEISLNTNEESYNYDISFPLISFLRHFFNNEPLWN
jgi:hypothetical protein